MRSARITMIAMLMALAVLAFQTADAKKIAHAAAGIKTAKLTVPGADCASTGSEADGLLRDIKGVSFVEVDIDETTAIIKYDASIVTIEQIKEVMKAGDYPVTAVEEL